MWRGRPAASPAVSHHRVAHDLQLLGRTELKVLGARLGAGRDVPCLDVESVSGLEYLFVVTAVERETPRPLNTYPQCGHEHLSSSSPLNSGVASRSCRIVRN